MKQTLVSGHDQPRETSGWDEIETSLKKVVKLNFSTDTFFMNIGVDSIHLEPGAVGETYGLLEIKFVVIYFGKF
jgi:hypothetical protein